MVLRVFWIRCGKYVKSSNGRKINKNYQKKKERKKKKKNSVDNMFILMNTDVQSCGEGQIDTLY